MGGRLDFSWRKSTYCDQGPEPTQQGIGSDEGGEFSKPAPTDELGFASQSDSLGVGEAPGFAATLFGRT